MSGNKKTERSKGFIKLTIKAGKANPAPPIGPALGQHKVNIMEFCKQFNDRTKSMDSDTPVPVEITVNEDKTFTFICKTPPTSYYLKKLIKKPKGSSAAKKDPSIAKITMLDCTEIAKIKSNDLNAYSPDIGARIVKGSAESMGIEVIEG